MADMYAQTRDSLEVTHTVSIENPDRVTLRQSDKQLTVEIEGENGNPDFIMYAKSTFPDLSPP